MTIRSMKNVAVLTEDGGICPLFRAHPGGFDSSRVPTPGICHPRQEKLMPGGQPKGGRGGGGGAGRSRNWLMHYDRYVHNQICVLACNDPLLYRYAGRIKQRILCCRKFIIIFGSSDLFIEQLLALAECRLLMFSFRAWQKYCILSLPSLGRFSEGILINICSKKNAFVGVFTLSSDYLPF